MGESVSVRANKIITILQDVLPINKRDFVSLWVDKEFSGDTFKILVATILSQSTNDKASLGAYNQLDSEIGVSPENLAKASHKRIEDCIRRCGLQRMKAKSLKSVSSEVVENRDMLQSILKLPLEEARRSLMTLTGVGRKTADVVLLTAGNIPTIPIDTHVERVSKRLQLVPEKAKYEDIRSSLEQLFPMRFYHSSHLLLIALGRRYCKAIRPLCKKCPINEFCPYPKQ